MTERTSARLAVVVLVLVVSGCAGWSPSNVMDASVADDGRPIALVVTNCKPTHRAGVRETPSSIEVGVVSMGKSPGDCAASVFITLDEPLGDRVLIDRYDGQTIPQREGWIFGVP